METLPWNFVNIPEPPHLLIEYSSGELKAIIAKRNKHDSLELWHRNLYDVLTCGCRQLSADNPAVKCISIEASYLKGFCDFNKGRSREKPYQLCVKVVRFMKKLHAMNMAKALSLLIGKLRHPGGKILFLKLPAVPVFAFAFLKLVGGFQLLTCIASLCEESSAIVQSIMVSRNHSLRVLACGIAFLARIRVLCLHFANVVAKLYDNLRPLALCLPGWEACLFPPDMHPVNLSDKLTALMNHGLALPSETIERWPVELDERGVQLTVKGKPKQPKTKTKKEQHFDKIMSLLSDENSAEHAVCDSHDALPDGYLHTASVTTEVDVGTEVARECMAEVKELSKMKKKKLRQKLVQQNAECMSDRFHEEAVRSAGLKSKEPFELKERDEGKLEMEGKPKSPKVDAKRSKVMYTDSLLSMETDDPVEKEGKCDSHDTFLSGCTSSACVFSETDMGTAVARGCMTEVKKLSKNKKKLKKKFLQHFPECMSDELNEKFLGSYCGKCPEDRKTQTHSKSDGTKHKSDDWLREEKTYGSEGHTIDFAENEGIVVEARKKNKRKRSTLLQSTSGHKQVEEDGLLNATYQSPNDAESAYILNLYKQQSKKAKKNKKLILSDRNVDRSLEENIMHNDGSECSQAMEYSASEVETFPVQEGVTLTKLMHHKKSNNSHTQAVQISGDACIGTGNDMAYATGGRKSQKRKSSKLKQSDMYSHDLQRGDENECVEQEFPRGRYEATNMSLRGLDCEGFLQNGKCIRSDNSKSADHDREVDIVQISSGANTGKESGRCKKMNKRKLVHNEDESGYVQNSAAEAFSQADLMEQNFNFCNSGKSHSKNNLGAIPCTPESTARVDRTGGKKSNKNKMKYRESENPSHLYENQHVALVHGRTADLDFGDVYVRRSKKSNKHRGKMVTGDKEDFSKELTQGSMQSDRLLQVNNNCEAQSGVYDKELPPVACDRPLKKQSRYYMDGVYNSDTNTYVDSECVHVRSSKNPNQKRKSCGEDQCANKKLRGV